MNIFFWAQVQSPKSKSKGRNKNVDSRKFSTGARTGAELDSNNAKPKSKREKRTGGPQRGERTNMRRERGGKVIAMSLVRQ
jgi:hypothetical protein